jgi:hypothetical protein
MDQPDLFTTAMQEAGRAAIVRAETAERLTDQAVEAVEAGADDQWLRAARARVEVHAACRQPFTTDEIWADLSRLHPQITTPEPRAMGAVIRAAVKDGLIKATGGYKASERPECHRNPKRIWIGK